MQAMQGSLQNPYHTCRFASYVPVVVHRVANLRRSIRIYQTLRIHILKARHCDEPEVSGSEIGAEEARCLHGADVEFLALDPRVKPEDNSAGRGIKT